MSSLIARTLRRVAETLRRPPWLARRLVEVMRLVPGRSLRSKLYLVFSWPLSEDLRTRFRARTVAGPMLVDPQTMMGRVLTVSGEWEPHVTAAFLGRLAAGDVCVDVGAHIGYYTLLAAGAVGPAGSVYALEPSARVFETLTTNLALNECDNVSALRLAAGSEAGEAVLFEAPGPSPLTSSLSPRMLEAPHGGRAQEFVPKQVSVAPLDGVVPADVHARVRVVKIDVEGYEVEVLRGMERLLSTGGPIAVFVETSPEWANEDPAAFLTDLCRRHGLSPYVVQNDYSLDGYFPQRLLPPVPVTTIPAERRDLMLVRDGR